MNAATPQRAITATGAPCRRRLAATTTLATVLLAPTLALAWPHGPTNNINLESTFAVKDPPAAAPDGAGGVYVVWSEQRATRDIVAQRLDANGNVLWAAGGVPVCTAAGEQRDPAIVSLPGGGVMIGWVDRRTGTADIYAQRLSPAGVPAWAADGVAVVAITGQDETAVQMAYQQSGVYFVWQDGAVGSRDIYGQRLNLNGSREWAAGGVAIGAATGDQTAPQLAADVTFLGCFVAWTDARAGAATDIYVQGVTFSGLLNGPAGGVPVCTATGEQSLPSIAALPAGQLAIVWRDERAGNADLYTQKLSGAGPSPVFAPNGVAVVTGPSDPTRIQVVSDEAGGYYTICLDQETPGLTTIRGQRVSPFGANLWVAEGDVLAVGTAMGGSSPKLVADGIGGAIVFWQDGRLGGNSLVLAQRFYPNGSQGFGLPVIVSQSDFGNVLAFAPVSDARHGAILAYWSQGNSSMFVKRVDRFGMTGAEPVITSVRDVANDQGGKVKVSWNASPLDVDPAFQNIQEYWLLREVPASLVATRERVAFRLKAGEPAPPVGARAIVEIASTPGNWEFVASVPAARQAGYSKVVPTEADSVAAGNPRTRFLVQARISSSAGWWDSNPDSGYSVDNLAPSQPAPFSGNYASGVGTLLTWGANLELDLGGYRLYRGASASFVPGPENLVAATAQTNFTDLVPGPVYKLSAVDVHGNESPFAQLVPSGLVDAPQSGDPSTIRLAAPTPNPGRGLLQFRFGLPRAEHVRLCVLDAQGRRVRELVSGVRGAGEWSAHWDGRDDRGTPSAGGLYWLRLETAGQALQQRFVRLR